MARLGGDNAGRTVYRPHMDSYRVTDEGNGIIRVDGAAGLVRKPMASALCDAVEERVSAAGYSEFKILMNMSAMSKGTPSAGLHVLRTMKKYPLRSLALYGANGFMRGMAKTVLGIGRFSNFELFDEETLARSWLERNGAAAPATGWAPDQNSLKRIALSATALLSGTLLLRARRRGQRVGDSPQPAD